MRYAASAGAVVLVRSGATAYRSGAVIPVAPCRLLKPYRSDSKAVPVVVVASDL